MLFFRFIPAVATFAFATLCSAVPFAASQAELVARLDEPDGVYVAYLNLPSNIDDVLNPLRQTAEDVPVNATLVDEFIVTLVETLNYFVNNWQGDAAVTEWDQSVVDQAASNVAIVVVNMVELLVQVIAVVDIHEYIPDIDASTASVIALTVAIFNGNSRQLMADGVQEVVSDLENLGCVDILDALNI